MGKKKQDDGYTYYQFIDPVKGLVDIDPKEKTEVKKETKKQPHSDLPLHMFVYEGAVKQFDRCVIPFFQATTMAVSKKKAVNNILYKAKRECDLAPSAGGFMLVEDVIEM